MLISQLYVISGANELTFIKSFEGIEGSLKYKMGTFCINCCKRLDLRLKDFIAEGLLEEAVKICERESLWSYGSVFMKEKQMAYPKNTQSRKSLQKSYRND